MRRLQNRAGWLALLLGAALAACLPGVCAAPDEDPPPEGFVWEDLKEFHLRLPRPERWFDRREPNADMPGCSLAPQPFEDGSEVKKGLRLGVVRKVAQQKQKPADEFAEASLAEIGRMGRIIRGSTRKGEPAGPYTTYVLVADHMDAGNNDGDLYEVEVVMIANRETDTLYVCILSAPDGQWKDVEKAGETILANLRLDPKF